MSIYIYILPKELQHVRTMGTLSSASALRQQEELQFNELVIYIYSLIYIYIYTYPFWSQFPDNRPERKCHSEHA